MWKIANSTDWESLQQFEWVRDMTGVPQSPVHHAEGDVAVHTRMVMEALEQLPDFRNLPEQEQHVLRAAALLHDVEKRSATFTDEHGEIVSPGHAKKGAQTVRRILYTEIPTPFAIREQLVKLVRYHGLPLWIFDKPDPVKSLLKAALHTDMRLLCILATADVMGRICKDREELLYRIAMFRELCMEQGCWDGKLPFASDHGRFLYFRKAEQPASYEPFDDTVAEVVLMSGLAGSGKDFFVQKVFRELPVISLDDLRRRAKVAYNDARGNGRIVQEAREMAREYLRKGQPFVWNATNITEQMRSQLIELFAVYRPRVRIVYIEVPYRELLKQNAGRTYAIPGEAVQKMIAKLEVPEHWEAHRVVYVIRE